MFVNIVNLLACLPSDCLVRLDFDFVIVEGRAGSILDDSLFQEFDFSDAITNNIHLCTANGYTIVISVYSIHNDDLPPD